MRRLTLTTVCLLAFLGFAATAASSDHNQQRRPLVISGKASVYGPPYEGAGRTATGESSAAPGFAARTGPFDRSYCVTLNHGRLHAVLRRIDYGPAGWTGRAIDITGAGVAQLHGRGHFATDQQAHARLLPRKRGPAWSCGRR